MKNIFSTCIFSCIFLAVGLYASEQNNNERPVLQLHHVETVKISMPDGTMPDANFNDNRVTHNYYRPSRSQDDPNKTFREKFNESMRNGSWDALQAAPTVLMQLLIQTGGQLAAAGIMAAIHNYNSQASPEEKALIDSSQALNLITQQLEVNKRNIAATKESLEEDPANEVISQDFERLKKERKTLIEKRSQLQIRQQSDMQHLVEQVEKGSVKLRILSSVA